MKYIILLFIIVITGCSKLSTLDEDESLVLSSKIVLGEELFLDENLSFNRTMSCATCHNPNHGFIDNRLNSVFSAVSLGQDNTTFGDRNSPTVAYAAFSPAFSQVGPDFIGGQFFDGRASDLVEQAKGPFLNAAEMQMPSEESVVLRVMENGSYISAFQDIYGEAVFDNTTTAFNAIADAIASFESSDEVSPFDSKFDIGVLTAQEIRGQALFRSANCTACHDDRNARPLFTDFSYKNIGVPINSAVRALNGQGTDEGLFSNPAVTDTNQIGRFKVSSLRNIGVTAPYMHNGIFQNLKTVVHFYNTRDVPGAINPETGLGWAVPEIATGVETQDVGNLGLTDAQEDDIVAFLKTLTDRNFESLQ